MAIWGSRKQVAKSNRSAWYVQTNGDSGSSGRVPKGYVPMVLIGDGEDHAVGQRVLDNVRMLREPCMAALLEMAEQQLDLADIQMVNAMVSKAAR
ncbi:hypothetical protein BS78_08G161500 [Paspalum vaginatum]|nr:hypothetical protein BS78_08G161500 [Paspalum vaginatum]